jgi:mRNA deadenylase 3'-5' endonuclease subunit Ccr4
VLQEVQADHYEQDILPELNEQGYEGLYKNKTREAMGAQGKVHSHRFTTTHSTSLSQRAGASV